VQHEQISNLQIWNKFDFSLRMWYTFKMRQFTIHFDGSCWPNPAGTAAYGTVVEQLEQTEFVKAVICEEAGVIGTGPEMSNNVAEFHALLIGLRRYTQNGVQQYDEITVRGDSQLVIQIMNGNWRPKDDKLYYPTFLLVKERVEFLKKLRIKFIFEWIPREQNDRCDKLSKEHNNAPK
jgi:ribonuclease HI